MYITRYAGRTPYEYNDIYTYIWQYIYVLITSRVIVVSETVYSELQKIKKNESFSKAIEELIKDKMQKGDISQLESFFGTLDKKDGSSWKGEVNRSRRAFGKTRLSSD